jgi:hypothetical protein
MTVFCFPHLSRVFDRSYRVSLFPLIRTNSRCQNCDSFSPWRENHPLGFYSLLLLFLATKTFSFLYTIRGHSRTPLGCNKWYHLSIAAAWSLRVVL